MAKRGFYDYRNNEIDDETKNLLKKKEKWICTTTVSLWTYKKNIFWACFFVLLAIVLLFFIRENTILTFAGDGYNGFEAARRYDFFTTLADYWGRWYIEVIKIFPFFLAWNSIQNAIIQILFFKIILTNSRIILVNGFISKDVTDLKLDKIETMRVNQDITGKWFNYGDLIFHGTGETKITVGGIDNPYKFKRYVDHYQQEDYEHSKKR